MTPSLETRADPIARVRSIVGWAFWVTVVAIVGLLVYMGAAQGPQSRPQAANHVAGAFMAPQSVTGATEPPAWVTEGMGRYPCDDGETRRYEQFGPGLWRSWCEVSHD